MVRNVAGAVIGAVVKAVQSRCRSRLACAGLGAKRVAPKSTRKGRWRRVLLPLSSVACSVFVRNAISSDLYRCIRSLLYSCIRRCKVLCTAASRYTPCLPPFARTTPYSEHVVQSIFALYIYCDNLPAATTSFSNRSRSSTRGRFNMASKSLE